MKKKISEILSQNCLFKTKRVSVLNWNYVESTNVSTDCVLKVMTHRVTKALPDGWQNLDTIEKADKWIAERKADSNFYAILLRETRDIIGFLFLYNVENKNEINDLRLGYLLAEYIWGVGIGSELIEGLVSWCKESEIISSISGGIEKDNIGSIKVLEKNGFYSTNEQLPGDMLLYKIDLDEKCSC